jgi:hypothetical protein
MPNCFIFRQSVTVLIFRASAVLRRFPAYRSRTLDRDALLFLRFERARLRRSEVPSGR